MKPNWKQKTLESLEKSIWPAISSQEASYLVLTCHSLRKKKLLDFTAEDLRIMIGQNIGLEYLIPMALEILEENILAEGDLYEGDLLSAVLSSNLTFWKADKQIYKTLSDLFKKNEQALKNSDANWEIKKKWSAMFTSLQNAVEN